MQQDEEIWQAIRHNHCSFMAKTTGENFCRNPYNVTGMYWPKLVVHKVKQRLTKMTQMRIRMRNLALKTREMIMTMPRKDTQRDARRASTAEKAAMVEKAIEKELQERLKMGVCPRDIDYHPKPLVDDVVPDYEEPEIKYVEGYDLEEEDDIEDFEAPAINGPDILDGDQAGVGEYDSEERRTTDHMRVRREYNLEPRKPEQEESSIKLKKPKVLIEIEHEDVDGTQRAAAPLYFNSFSINRNQHISC